MRAAAVLGKMNSCSAMNRRGAGRCVYVCHRMRDCGLSDLLASLEHPVWFGMSAGSMAMAPRVGREFVGWRPPDGQDRTLGMDDFSIFSHLDNEHLPDNTLTKATMWAAGLGSPARRSPHANAASLIQVFLLCDCIAQGYGRVLVSVSEACVCPGPGAGNRVSSHLTLRLNNTRTSLLSCDITGPAR